MLHQRSKSRRSGPLITYDHSARPIRGVYQQVSADEASGIVGAQGFVTRSRAHVLPVHEQMQLHDSSIDVLSHGQRGEMPQLPRHASPGARCAIEVPERSASGGHVIGSIAIEVRRFCNSVTLSAVYTIR